MCRRVTCNKCGRPDWTGCGAHIEQVLGDVPKSERCQCRETPVASPARSVDPPTKPASSWLKRLFG